MFSRILIANRGEIAVRVIRACRQMGIASVAVYADCDRDSLHVSLADFAYPLEGATPRAAYLDIEQLLKVARRAGAEAIHPGYGFVSENPALPEACVANGITFIGPSADVIRRLGNKNQARDAMKAAGLPLVPGSNLTQGEDVAQVAQQIGYPVLIKAAGGGGGRGMRKVDHPKDLDNLFQQARSESLTSFGSDELFIEKYVVHPRHVEIQVLGDSHGQAIYLGERECSIQRRFQKMIEEAPSPVVTPELRQRMGQAAAKGAREVGYVGAGTFEFLVDKDLNFYFLEVNTRLQVEHPVTEQVYGVDLVQAQIEVAAGHPLPWKQEELKPRGWAFECRITCEDPYRNFLPCPGQVQQLRLPQGAGVRLDTHLYPGYQVPQAFDSMVAKLITFGEDREQARRRMLGALAEFQITGIPTSIPFHQQILEHPEFIAGNLSTHFIADHLPHLARCSAGDIQELAALAAALESLFSNAPPAAAATRSEAQVWKEAGRVLR